MFSVQHRSHYLSVRIALLSQPTPGGKNSENAVNFQRIANRLRIKVKVYWWGKPRRKFRKENLLSFGNIRSDIQNYLFSL